MNEHLTNKKKKFAIAFHLKTNGTISDMCVANVQPLIR